MSAEELEDHTANSVALPATAAEDWEAEALPPGVSHDRYVKVRQPPPLHAACVHARPRGGAARLSAASTQHDACDAGPCAPFFSGSLTMSAYGEEGAQGCCRQLGDCALGSASRATRSRPRAHAPQRPARLPRPMLQPQALQPHAHAPSLSLSRSTAPLETLFCPASPRHATRPLPSLSLSRPSACPALRPSPLTPACPALRPAGAQPRARALARRCQPVPDPGGGGAQDPGQVPRAGGARVMWRVAVALAVVARLVAQQPQQRDHGPTRPLAWPHPWPTPVCAAQVAVAWRLLGKHGYINFGVAPPLMREPLAARGAAKSVVIVGAGLAGKQCANGPGSSATLLELQLLLSRGGGILRGHARARTHAPAHPRTRPRPHLRTQAPPPRGSCGSGATMWWCWRGATGRAGACGRCGWRGAGGSHCRCCAHDT